MENLDINKAIKYLEEIQKEYKRKGCLTINGSEYDELDYEQKTVEDSFHAAMKGIKGTLDNSKEVLDASEKLMTQSVLDNSKKFSKLEPYNHIGLLSLLRSELLNSAKVIGFPINENFIMGTVPNGQINAQTVESPSGVFIILFNNGLFSFIDLFSKVFAGFLPVKKDLFGNASLKLDKKIVDKNIKKDGFGNYKFRQLMRFYLIFGNARGTAPFEIKKHLLPIRATLTNTIEFFILAHEYSHIIYHRSSPKEKLIEFTLPDDFFIKRFNSANFDTNDFNKAKKSWLEEFEADILAVQLTLNHNMEKTNSIVLSYLGIELFFATMSMLYDAIEVQDTITHPSVKERHAIVRQMIADNFNEKIATSLFEYGDIIHYTINKLWENNKKEFFDNKKVFLNNKEGVKKMSKMINSGGMQMLYAALSNDKE